MNAKLRGGRSDPICRAEAGKGREVAPLSQTGYCSVMKSFPAFTLALVLLGIGFCGVRADQIEMQNGDRYNGKLLAMTNGTLVLQSEILGTINLPREKVSQINLGDGARKTGVAKANNAQTGTLQKKGFLPGAGTAGGQGTLAVTNSVTSAATSDQKDLMEQVQNQFLAGAGPEVTSKYQEMVNGFLTGQISLADIRSQAKSAAEQLRAARKDLGEDSGIALDGYLAILDSFLKETASSVDSTRPSAPATSQSTLPSLQPKP